MAREKTTPARQHRRDVTPRRRPRRLSPRPLNEEWFRSLCEASPFGICTADVTGRCTYTNSRWQEMSGLSREASLGRGWLRAVHPEDRKRLADDWSRAMQADGKMTSEFRLRRPDGSVVWIASRTEPIRSANGRIIGYVGADEDITARKRTEELRRLEHEISRLLTASDSLLETVPVLVWTLAEFLGWEVGEFWEIIEETKTMRVLHTWHAPGRRLAAYVRSSERQAVSMLDGLPSRVRTTGQPAWLPDLARSAHFIQPRAAARAGLRSALVFPVKVNERMVGVIGFLTSQRTEPDRELLEMFASLGGQIGQFMRRRKAEEALRRSEANLALAQQLARLGGNDIDLHHPANNHWSDETYRILGWERPARELTLDEYIARCVHPEDQSRVRQAFDHACDQCVRADIVYRIVRSDGSIRYLHNIVEPVPDRRGAACRLVGTLQDITDRKELEREILEISEREQDRIGHDLHDGLCQQLAGIEFRLLALKQRLQGKSGVQREAEEANELTRLVRQAIDQTRTLARGLSPVKVDTDGLMSALRELIDTTERTFKIPCLLRCPAPVPVHDNAVATHLFRIAQEAIHNAIRHGRAKLITVNFFTQNDRIVLGVTDNGIGFPKTPGKHHGMGLRVMRYRAGMIGGSLVIQRKPEGGTSVLCSLHRGSLERRS